MGPGQGSWLGPRSPPGAGALIQARGPQTGKHCSSKPRRGEWLGPQNPPAVGALLQMRGPQRGKHYPSRPRRGEWLGATESAGGGGVATDAEATKGRVLFTKSCDETGSDRGYRPMCARWRSTAAIAAAVIASTICCIEGGESAPGAFFALVSATREGGRWARSQRLDIRGGNGGASMLLCSAARNMRGGTCRLSSRSRPGRRGC